MPNFCIGKFENWENSLTHWSEAERSFDGNKGTRRFRMACIKVAKLISMALYYAAALYRTKEWGIKIGFVPINTNMSVFSLRKAFATEGNAFHRCFKWSIVFGAENLWLNQIITYLVDPSRVASHSPFLSICMLFSRKAESTGVKLSFCFDHIRWHCPHHSPKIDSKTIAFVCTLRCLRRFYKLNKIQFACVLNTNYHL